MEAVGYYIFLVFNWIITLLPLSVLYIFSDLLYFIFYHFPGYRKNVVSSNLRNAFPYKTDSERGEIERKFYRHLADLFIETLKLKHMSKKELSRRCVYENPELLDRIKRDGKDTVAVLGHYNNWEFLSLLPQFVDYTCLTIYKPLKNQYFDNFLKKSRSKFGMILAPMSMIVREILERRKNKERTVTYFLSDQTPAKGDIHYWTTFLNQDTPVYLGAEKIALKYNMAVVFINMRKVKRGCYKVKFDLLFDSTAGLRENQVTEAHVKHLEEIIKENPEYWIWSHRRWKHKREYPDV
jgi:Kdo2-lipid IVA lauroyltransferase/acyltransferase